MRDLGDIIKCKRKEAGYSQAELAKLMKAKDETIMKIETGRSIPRPDTINRIAKVLNFSESELKECHDLIASYKQNPRAFSYRYTIKTADRILSRRSK